LIQDHAVTDLVVYGDTRPIHAQAIEIAKQRGITVHVFEEGYLRPYWVTYERNGSNGHSRLMEMTLADMQEALKHSDLEMPMPPSHWGDTRHHVFYGALYHWFVMFANRRYPNFRPHRSITVTQEFQLYLKRLVMMPIHRWQRLITTARITQGGFPYHLVLLQLEHDASFQQHSPFSSMAEFLDLTVANFAKHAPRHHHLVFKAHPLEDGRAAIKSTLARLAKTYDIENRIHFVRGGKLARLLDEARSAITVNSTAGQQVLWRGIPLKAFGTAVYGKPEFVSDLSLAEFFKSPNRPDGRAYRDYRRYLLETSQILWVFWPGSVSPPYR
jgi:capsular polysaccharide export protein